MKYFDSHAHYYDERFATETEEGADKIVGALLSSSVSGIVNVATSPESAKIAVEQAKTHENMYTAIGIHPYDANFVVEDMEKAIRDAINALNKTLPTYKQVKGLELRDTEFEKTTSRKIKRHLVK